MAKESECFAEELPSNLVELRKITKALEFHDTVRPQESRQIKEFILDVGTSYMVGLYKNHVMAVTRVYSSAGCEFPPHTHDEWELIIVYQGEIHLDVDGKIKKLKQKEFYYIEPGTPHGAYYPVDSWVLCVTMPASLDFPDGG